jgi:hypothetical protein
MQQSFDHGLEDHGLEIEVRSFSHIRCELALQKFQPFVLPMLI